MARSDGYFKVGNKVNVGRRNAAKEYRATFTQEIFDEGKADLRLVFKQLIDVAKNLANDSWLEATKVLARHFITVPPTEMIVEDETKNTEYELDDVLNHHQLTAEEIIKYKELLKEKADNFSKEAIEEIVRQRASKC